MERGTRLELATNSLEGCDSTIELPPHLSFLILPYLGWYTQRLMPRYFTFEQAESALPAAERSIREAVQLKVAYQTAEQQMNDISRNIVMTGGMAIDHGKVIGIKETREKSGARLGELLERLQDSGCLVKDLDAGLLDFPTLYQDREVYLCWRLGEHRIEFWHEVDEGFQGRHPIDDSFLRQHRGEAD